MSADTAAVVSSIAAAISAFLTLVAVGVAVASLKAAEKETKQANQNAAEDRRVRDRPLLVPELEKEHLTHGATNFVIRNWGRSAAVNVRIKFVDPEPPSDIDDLPGDDMLKWIFQAYNAPITLWPPNWRMSHVYIWGPEDQRRKSKLSFALTYEGPDRHPYSDQFTLDPAPFLTQTSSGPSRPSKDDTDGWVKDAATSLRAIARKI